MSARSVTGTPSSGIRRFEERHHFDLRAQSVALPPWIHHPKFVQLQILESKAHGRRQRRRVRALALDSDTTTPLEQEQVEFGTLIRGPLVRLVRPHRLEHFFDRIP